MLIAIAFLLVAADDFDRLEGRVLSGIPQSADAELRETLSVADLGTLPNVLKGTRTGVVIVKTSEANLSRLLIYPALRIPPGNKGEAAPIMVLERFDTFEAGPAVRKMAKGRDVTLFDGFRFDLDSGQVVPDGQGGDLQFLATGEGGPRLVSLGNSRMFTLKKSPLPEAAKTSGPSSGRIVLPTDFVGKYRLYANGQTSGNLEIRIEDEGVITGRMRSDQTGGSYKVTGKIGPDATNHVRFSVELPRARQEFDGYLFLEGKGAIAGTFTLLDRPFGFFAIREGGSVVPDGEEVGAKQIEAQSRKFVVEAGPGDRLIVDGKPVDETGLSDAARAFGNDDGAAVTIVRCSVDLPYQRLSRILSLLREAGAGAIRLEAPKTPEK